MTRPRPIGVVIRDWFLAMIDALPDVFPFGRALTEWVRQGRPWQPHPGVIPNSALGPLERAARVGRIADAQERSLDKIFEESAARELSDDPNANWLDIQPDG